MEPLFLTHKLTVDGLQSVYNVYDFQLRDHLLTTDDIYLSRCKCYHTHNKQRCPLVPAAYCRKCDVANEKYINYRSLLFHQTAAHSRLARCCTHVHRPPCGNCLGCRTTSTCVVQLPFECDYTTEATCAASADGAPHFTKPMKHAQLMREHIYNTRSPVFYFCNAHAHSHRHEHEPYGRLTCFVQTRQCCERATLVTDFESSFVITIIAEKRGKVAETGTARGDTTKRVGASTATTAAVVKKYVKKQYVIFDPTLWREQSMNHFVSLLRAVVNMPEMVAERYRRFESSNFKVANIKKYKSGKQSIVRTAITGFETKGIYQTATISCTLPSRTVLIPQKIYDLMADDYDLSLVAVKRDPSIKQTCMFVCRAERNADPDVDTLVISDAIAKPMNQDQDGDKNGVYVLPKRARGGYRRDESFLHRLARLELAAAYAADKTLIATPRYSFSEYNLLVMYRRRVELMERSEFYRRTCRKGTEHMIEAGCGYLRAEYEDFCRLLLEINARRERFCVTLDDVVRKTDIIPSIVESGAKGHCETMHMMFENLRSDCTLFDKKQCMIDQMNRYISSSQDLRHTGRNQFISLYAAHDMTAVLGFVYVNKRFYADYKPFSSVGTLMFSEGSLDEFIEDLKLS